MLLANYLTKSTDVGALGLSQEEKGLIMGIGTAILYFLPIISGGVYGRMSDKVTLLQNDLASKGLSVPEISNTFTQTDLYNKAGEFLNMTQAELTNYLWTSYNPGRIWLVLLGIGIGASFLLFLYDRLLIRKTK